MTISGAILADFSSYNAAVEGAVVKLRSFGEGSNKVSASLSRMTDSFSGRKVIQEATLMAEVVARAGGTATFTKAELERMGAVGAAAMAKLVASGAPVPPGIARIAAEARSAEGSLGSMVGMASRMAGAFGIAFSVGAVVNYGNKVLETADRLVVLSDKTGLFIDDIQRLEYIGGQSGNTLDELTGSISKMQLNLNDPKARAAFRDLNIDIAELTAARPYEQFEMIATAAGQIEDPVKLAEAAVAIFGKRGIEIIPTLKAKFAELSAEVVTSGDAQTQALERLGDALSKQSTNVKNYVQGYIGGIALVAEEVGIFEALALRIAADFGGGGFAAIEADAVDAAAAVAEVNAVLPASVDVLATYREQLDAVGESVEDLTGDEMALIEHALSVGQSTGEIATAMNLAVPTVELYAASVKALASEEEKAAAESKKFAAALAELDAAGLTTQQTIDGINGSVVEAIKYYLAAGVAQSTLATAYGLTAAQVRAVSSAMAADRAAATGQTQVATVAVQEYGAKAVEAHTAAAAAIQAEVVDLAKLAAANNRSGGSQSYDSLEDVLAAPDLMSPAREQLIAYFTAKEGPALTGPSAAPITAPRGGYGGGATVTVPVNVTGTSARDIGQQVEAALVKDAKFKRLMGTA
jgi:hypothetical protein